MFLLRKILVTANQDTMWVTGAVSHKYNPLCCSHHVVY